MGAPSAPQMNGSDYSSSSDSNSSSSSGGSNTSSDDEGDGPGDPRAAVPPVRPSSANRQAASSSSGAVPRGGVVQGGMLGDAEPSSSSSDSDSSNSRRSAADEADYAAAEEEEVDVESEEEQLAFQQESHGLPEGSAFEFPEFHQWQQQHQHQYSEPGASSMPPARPSAARLPAASAAQQRMQQQPQQPHQSQRPDLSRLDSDADYMVVPSSAQQIYAQQTSPHFSSGARSSGSSTSHAFEAPAASLRGSSAVAASPFRADAVGSSVFGESTPLFPVADSSNLNFSSAHKPAFHRIESEFSYDDAAMDHEEQRVDVDSSVAQQQELAHPPAAAVPAAAFLAQSVAPVTLVSDEAVSSVAAAPLQSTNALSPSAEAGAATAAPSPSAPPTAVAPVVHPLTSFLRGLNKMCDLCDEQQARVFCADCNQALCFGSSGGSIKGCAVSMHKRADKQGHSLFEITKQGTGAQIDLALAVLPQLQQQQPPSLPPQQQHDQPVPPVQRSESASAFQSQQFVPAEFAAYAATAATPTAAAVASAAPPFAADPRSSRRTLSSHGSSAQGSRRATLRPDTFEPPPDLLSAAAEDERAEAEAQADNNSAEASPAVPTASSAVLAEPVHATHTFPPSASAPASATPSSSSAESPASDRAATLSLVLSDVQSWTPTHVSCWLLGVAPELRSSSPDTLDRVLALGLSGRALRLDDRTLERELAVRDVLLRAKLLEAVAQLCADTDGKHVLVMSPSGSRRAAPLPSPIPEPRRPSLQESLASAAVSYSRAQLLFLLGEQTRLILQLQDENASLRAAAAQQQR